MEPVPHIETGGLAATLRECIAALSRALEATGVDRTEVVAAIANATREADALDTIRTQSHVFIFGRMSFEMFPGAFPMHNGQVAPTLLIKESDGEVSGIGFVSEAAARKIGAGIMALAFSYPFADPADTSHLQ